MKISEFIIKFRKFCEDEYGTKTGTAVSYVNAIKYLFQYIGADELTTVVLDEIKSIEPDIRNKSSLYYQDLHSFYSERGQSSYLEKGFLRASLLKMFECLNTVDFTDNQAVNESVLIEQINDVQINALFNPELLDGQVNINAVNTHNYLPRRTSGTAASAKSKLVSGRQAEKYFISYLKDYLGFQQGVDFFDVANNKKYGYDIRFKEIGLEVKNVKSGGFFLSDNEIARIELAETHLVLVGIHNGVWLLKNNSEWLKQRIFEIKAIREYCERKYKSLDLSDIKVLLDESILDELINVSNYTKQEFLNVSCINED